MTTHLHSATLEGGTLFISTGGQMIRADSKLNNKVKITRMGYNTIVSVTGEGVGREDGREARFASDFEPSELGQELPPGEYIVNRYSQRLLVAHWRKYPNEKVSIYRAA